MRALFDRFRAWSAGAEAQRIRKRGLPVALIGAAGLLLWTVHDHYPVEHWLVWVYARCVLLSGAWSLCCLSGGHVVVGRLLRQSPPLRERLLVDVAVGVLLFFLGMFLGGLLGLYGPLFAIGWPLALFALGAREMVALARRAWRLRQIWSRAGSLDLRILGLWVFGLAGVGLIYFAILTPGNVAYDALAYHLGLAQQYAVEGALTRSPEGYVYAAVPGLATLLYTWALLIPAETLFHRIELAAHLEFVLFLWTLVGIPTLVRWLVPRCDARGSWAAIFLFPGIFLYDSSLSVAADHIGAFWAIPIFLALRRAYRQLDPRECALLAALLAGALLTKYQCISLAALPVAAIIVRAIVLARRRSAHSLGGSQRPWLMGPLAALVAGAMLTAPHWLKNWVWYGDPLYPFLHEYLTVRPWNPDAAHMLDWFKGELNAPWRPHGTALEQVGQTLRALATFAFEPHDFPKFHGQVPVFGFLFSLMVPCLLFLRNTRRLWVLVLAVACGIVAWFWQLHVDRYLQILLPWMAAAVAAFIVLAWRRSRLDRGLLAGLLGLQIVWGGDVYFIPAHATLRDAPVRVVSELLARGHAGQYEERFVLDTYMTRVAEQLPADARLLLHEQNPRLGFWRPVVVDMMGWQGRISYGRLPTARHVYDELRSLGITHVVWRDGHSRGYDSLAGDLRFFDFVDNWTRVVVRDHGYVVAALTQAPPLEPQDRIDTVAYLGCGDTYGRGLHRWSAMTVPGRAPPPQAHPQPPQRAFTLETAEAPHGLPTFVVFDPRCGAPLPEIVRSAYEMAASRDGEQLWVRAVRRRMHAR